MRVEFFFWGMNTVPKIVSYNRIGVRPTCDIEVEHPDHQFYLANGLLTSNSCHAKPYGMVTFQTAYLRTYYPLEFFAALLTAGQAADLQTYVSEIRKQGFSILPVDVNMSKGGHLLEGTSIRLALGSVKGVGASAVGKVVAGQPYVDLVDFITRSGANKTVCENLIAVGALLELPGCPTISSGRARHGAYRADKKLSQKRNRELVGPTLAAVEDVADDPIECMQLERELLGFNLRGTPFSINGRWEKIDRLISAEMLTCATAAEFFADEDNRVGILPLVLKSFKERPQRNGKMFAFMQFADRDGGEIDAPAFGNTWPCLKEFVRAGDVYVVVLHRKDDDQTSLVVGKPGWKHSPESISSFMIPLDSIGT